MNQRDENVVEARRHGLVVVSSSYAYEPGTLDFRPVMASVLAGRDTPPVLKGITGQIGGPATPVGGRPDLIELSGVAPADAPLILIALRELGYGGLVCTETSQDALLLRDAGEAADGFISVGGGLAPELQSPAKEEFVRRYTARAGRWHDEASTKVYALEMILRTLQTVGSRGDRRRDAVPGGHPDLHHDRPVREGAAGAALWRRAHLQPAPADRGAAGGQRVPGRRLPAAVRRLGRLNNQDAGSE